MNFAEGTSPGRETLHKTALATVLCVTPASRLAPKSSSRGTEHSGDPAHTQWAPGTYQAKHKLVCFAWHSRPSTAGPQPPLHTLPQSILQHTPSATESRTPRPLLAPGRKTAFLPFFLPTCSTGSGAKSTSSKKLFALLLPLNAVPTFLTVLPASSPATQAPPPSREGRP